MAYVFRRPSANYLRKHGRRIVGPINSPKTISAQTGVFTLGGGAVALRVAHDLVATTGAFALSGVAANLLKGSRAPVAGGAFLLSGKPVNFLIGHLVSAAGGAFVLSGRNVSFSIPHRSLSVERGVFLLTGSEIGIYRRILSVKLITSAIPRRLSRLDQFSV